MSYTSKSGTLLDKQKQSYVESPSRGDNNSAQEVVIGDSQDLANKINRVSVAGNKNLPEIEMLCLLKDILIELKEMKIIINEISGLDL